MNQSKTIITAVALAGYILYLVATFIFNRNFYLQQQMLFQHIFGLLIICSFIENRTVQLPSAKVVVLILLICCVGFLSVHSSQDYLKSSIKTKLDLSIIATCYILYVSFRGYFKKYVILILCMLIIPWMMISWATLSEMHIVKGGEDVLRIWNYTYYVNIRHFSNHTFIIFCVSYILTRYVYNKKGLNLFLLLPVSLVSFYTFILLCLSSSRAALLSLAVFIFLSSFFNSTISKAVRDTLLLALIVISTYIIFIFTPFSASSGLILNHFTKLTSNVSVVKTVDPVVKELNTLVKGADTVVKKVDLSKKINRFAGGRINDWSESLFIGLEKPVYGHGAASFEWLSKRFKSKSRLAHPHNIIIQFIVEYGYLGAVLFLALFYMILMRLYLARSVIQENKELYNGLLSLVFSFLFYAQFTGLLFHTLPLLCFCLFLTILFSMSHSKS